MNAFLFTLGVFAYWGFVGYATLSIVNPRLRVIQSYLISPAVGLAVVLLPVFLINRAGVPVKFFGEYLLWGLLALSTIILLIKKPIFPARRLLALVSLLIAALAIAAWPMFIYHFDWVSYSNDDMANYCLAAQRFLDAGFFDLPNLNELYNGRNYSLAYWFMHVAAGVRPGSELMLAFWWAATGLDAHQLFMPIIFALHLCLVCGAGALVAGYNFRKKTPFIVMGLYAISPMATLGVLYQLIGQIGGLTLLCAAVVLFYRKITLSSLWQGLLISIVGGLIFSGLLIWYPELLPFLGLGWFLFLGLKTLQDRQNIKEIVIPALFIGFITLLLLGPFILTALQMMLAQAHINPLVHDPIFVFPFFLLPSGVNLLVGLSSLAGELPEPLASIKILLGWFILAWLCMQLVKQLRNPQPAAVVAAVMFSLGILLFYKRYDFGLFKLAMYIQPFIIAVAAAALSEWKKNKIGYLILCVLVLSAFYGQFALVLKSTGEVLGSLNEIPHASSKKLNKEFDSFIHALPKHNSTYYQTDVTNVVLAKFQGLYSQGISIYYPSRNYFESIMGCNKNCSNLNAFSDFKKKQYKIGKLPVGDVLNEFAMLQLPKDKKYSWLLAYHQTSFNQRHINADKNDIDFEQVNNPINHLVFVHSKLGAHYYSDEKRKIAFSQLEGDYFYPGQNYSGFGRHLLFMVVGGTKKPRLVLDLTATLVRQFNGQLPSPIIYGAKNTTVPFIGRGSGRIISEPIEPASIDGKAFIDIDMRRDGKYFIEYRPGFTSLYGNDVHKDSRHLAVHGRDISLISEEEYQAITPPSQLRQFPADLANPSLEYSGIYEDSWISERSFFVLEAKENTRFLLIKGLIPQVSMAPSVYARFKEFVSGGFNSSTLRSRLKMLIIGGGLLRVDHATLPAQLEVHIDGEMLSTKKLKPGSFEFKIPIQVAKGPQRIDLSFNNYYQLPFLDGRIVGAKIDFIGLVKG